MATITSDSDTASCWNHDHWLRNCEGYRVWWEGEPIGYVDAVLQTESGDTHSLVVRVGSTFTHCLAVPVEAVEGLDPEGERVFVALRPHAPDEAPEQLRIPALT